MVHRPLDEDAGAGAWARLAALNQLAAAAPASTPPAKTASETPITASETRVRLVLQRADAASLLVNADTAHEEWVKTGVWQS